MAELIEWATGTLRQTRDLTPDIRLFTIEPPPGFRPPSPGSHVHFLVSVGERTGYAVSRSSCWRTRAAAPLTCGGSGQAPG
jgi:ferredoxin-NADP reductase